MAPKVILVQQWSVLNSDLTLRSFTAEWCTPCTRIKPFLHALEGEGAISLLETTQMSTEDKRPGMLIPFFEMVDENGAVVRSIQTSQSGDFSAFLMGPRE